MGSRYRLPAGTLTAADKWRRGPFWRCHFGPFAQRHRQKAALIVVHHVRKSIGRDEIGRAFRGSSALHAAGDSYLLLARPSAETRQ